jgi:cytochrome c peroxidase
VEAAKRGWGLFNTKARCNKCHALTEAERDTTNFTDLDYHNSGIGIIRHNVRNVLVTPPYFHDGSQETLWDVMDHYHKGDGLQNPWLDEDIQPLALTEHDIDDVVAFLASLTSPEYKELGAQELKRQRALSRTSRPQRDTKRAFGPKPPRPKPPRP